MAVHDEPRTACSYFGSGTTSSGGQKHVTDVCPPPGMSEVTVHNPHSCITLENTDTHSNVHSDSFPSCRLPACLPVWFYCSPPFLLSLLLYFCQATEGSIISYSTSTLVLSLARPCLELPSSRQPMRSATMLGVLHLMVTCVCVCVCVLVSMKPPVFVYVRSEAEAWLISSG